MIRLQASSNSSSSRSPVLIASLTLFIIATVIVGVFYGDQVIAFATGKILGSADSRIQKRLALFEEQYQKQGRAPRELLDIIESTRKIVQLMEKEKPAHAEVYYYYSLLNYYELLVRVPLDGTALLLLTGRGYLPDMPEGSALPPASIPALAQEASAFARKSQAIEPGKDYTSRLNTALILGELLSTGRTDPHLLSVTLSVKGEDLTRTMKQSHDWIRFALFALQGKSAVLEQELTENKYLTEGPDRPADLILDVHESRLLLAHACFQAKDYNRTLMFARQVKMHPQAERIWKVDATRVEGDVFLVQNIPLAARGFYEEALRLAEGKDDFIAQKLDALSPARPAPGP
jgi:hypothetical protein